MARRNGPAVAEPMRVHVLSGTPGAGKSTAMLVNAAEHEGRYLFAVPSILLLEEQAKRLEDIAPSATVVRIHSRSGVRGAVKRQIADLLDQSGSHVVGFITHEGLLDADLSQFVGWHARIDEPPHGFHRGHIRIEESLPYFMAKFDLDPVGQGSRWSQLKPRASISWPKVQSDTLAKDLVDFRKLAARPQGIFVDVASWEETSHRPVTWFSLWTPLQLRSFESVVVAGAGYLTSLAYCACREIFGDDVGFDTSDMSEPRSAQPRITVHYFTLGHEGSTVYWNTDEGRSCLVSTCKWFERTATHIGYWSGNEVVRLLFHDRIEGERVSPKVAGLNSLRQHDSCLFLYSSKAQPNDVKLHDLLTMTDEDVRRAREDEDILQFAWRGAIRNPDYDGPYDIYLYSRDQAEQLASTLQTAGFLTVELRGVPEAGIMNVTRPQAKREAARQGTADMSGRLERKRERGRERARKHRAKKKAS